MSLAEADSRFKQRFYPGLEPAPSVAEGPWATFAPPSGLTPTHPKSVDEWGTRQTLVFVRNSRSLDCAASAAADAAPLGMTTRGEGIAGRELQGALYSKSVNEWGTRVNPRVRQEQQVPRLRRVRRGGRGSARDDNPRGGDRGTRTSSCALFEKRE